MANLIRKFHKMLFKVKTKQRLPRIPRMYANKYQRPAVSFDEARVFARVGARSPEGVRLVMKKFRLKSVNELIARLPHRAYRPNSRSRFRRWLQHVLGLYDYEPVVGPALRRLRQEGRSFGGADPVLKSRLKRALDGISETRPETLTRHRRDDRL
jgi:hypothetical protein